MKREKLTRRQMLQISAMGSAAVIAAGLAANTAVTRIGCIQAEPGVRLLDDFAQAVSLQLTSFDHFTTP